MQTLLVDYGILDRKHETHHIQETSKKSYRQLKRHPHELTARYKEVLQGLLKRKEPSTDQEICRTLGHRDPNYVRPRRYELVHEFNPPILFECEKRTCDVTGITACVWWFTNYGLEQLAKWRLI